MNPPADFQSAVVDLNNAVNRMLEARNGDENGMASADAHAAVRRAAAAIARAGYPGAPDGLTTEQP